MRVTISFRFKSKKARPDGTCPIYARITMQGKRVEVSTGIFADLENWDGIRQRLKGNSSKVRVVNNRLDKAYSNILDIYNQLEALNSTFTVIDTSDPNKLIILVWKSFFFCGTISPKQVAQLHRNINIETVSKILGHSSIKTTQIYARILDYKISEDMKKLQ